MNAGVGMVSKIIKAKLVCLDDQLQVIRTSAFRGTVFFDLPRVSKVACILQELCVMLAHVNYMLTDHEVFPAENSLCYSQGSLLKL